MLTKDSNNGIVGCQELVKFYEKMTLDISFNPPMFGFYA